MKRVFFLAFIVLFGVQSWSHEPHAFEFHPDRVHNPENLPFCKVVENKKYIQEVINNLEAQGKEEVRHDGDGNFCYEEVKKMGDVESRVPHCFHSPDSERLWILMVGKDRSGKSFQTRQEGFMEAAYKHAAGECIFPFTFYLKEE